MSFFTGLWLGFLIGVVATALCFALVLWVDAELARLRRLDDRARRDGL